MKVTTAEPYASGSVSDTFVAQLAEVASCQVEGEYVALVLVEDVDVVIRMEARVSH